MKHHNGLALAVREYIKANPGKTISQVAGAINYQRKDVENSIRKQRARGILEGTSRLGYMVYTWVRDPSESQTKEERRIANANATRRYRERLKAEGRVPVKRDGPRVLLTEEEKLERARAHNRKRNERKREGRRSAKVQPSTARSRRSITSIVAAAGAGYVSIVEGMSTEALREAGIRVEELPARWEKPLRYPAPGFGLSMQRQGARLSL